MHRLVSSRGAGSREAVRGKLRLDWPSGRGAGIPAARIRPRLSEFFEAPPIRAAAKKALLGTADRLLEDRAKYGNASDFFSASA